MKGEKILIIEDDPTLQRVLRDNFEFMGCLVSVAGDGKTGWQSVQTCQPGLVILDVMLPGINGFDLCRRLRAEGFAKPIIMLTAKGQESNIVLGLNVGADNYVTKPFSIDVLLARAKACLRRRANQGPVVAEFGDCRLDRTSHKLYRKAREVELAPKEFRLLDYFLKNAGRALTRRKILDDVWGQDFIVTERSVDRCINTLRNKVEPDPQHPAFIQTIRDVGYRFEA